MTVAIGATLILAGFALFALALVPGKQPEPPVRVRLVRNTSGRTHVRGYWTQAEGPGFFCKPKWAEVEPDWGAIYRSYFIDGRKT
jgi:hypothetical protein